MTEPPCVSELKKMRSRDPALIDATVRNLHALVVSIRCEAGEPDWMQMQTTQHAVRLALRIFPNVSIDFSNKQLAKGAHRIASGLGLTLSDQVPTHHLTVGQTGRTDDIRIDASNWKVRACQPNAEWTPFQTRQPHPATPLLAACLGVGGLTSGILGHEWKPLRELSFWDGAEDGPTLPERLQIKDWHLLSLGSIGTSAALLLQQWPNVEGKLTLLDRDSFAEHNPARYVAAVPADLDKVKVDHVMKGLSPHRSLNVTAIHSTIENWVESLTTEVIPLAVVSFDNLAARAHAADAFPRHCVAATVNTNDAVAVNCDFLHGACSFCVVGPRTSATDGLRMELARLTGLPPERVNVLLFYAPASERHLEVLTNFDLHVIEGRWKLHRGALKEYKGKRLPKLVEDQRHLAYSSVQLAGESPALNLPVPMPSAAAGALALNAALRHELGYSGRVNELRFNPMTGAYRPGIFGKNENKLCLCQDPFRQQLYRELHGSGDEKERR